MSDAITNLNLDFSTSPTVWKFLKDKSFVRGLMGPVGSGKSYACAAEIMLKAVSQVQSPRDGIKYSRFVVVRNSYPELRTTTNRMPPTSISSVIRSSTWDTERAGGQTKSFGITDHSLARTTGMRISPTPT